MTILDALRGRSSTEDASASTPEAGPTSAPFEGYDGVEIMELIHSLDDHSQVELEAVEAYERSHKNREAVLYKLRYLRGPEPIPGYDALDDDQILAAVADADLETIKRIRGYERKFAKRPELLETIVRAQRAQHAALPKAEVPAYQPLSATSTDAS
jgi:hypothetical protein